MAASRDLQLRQVPITLDALRRVVGEPPRRIRIDKTKALRAGDATRDPCLSFRFKETHKNLMRTAPGDIAPSDGKNGTVYAYLKGSAAERAAIGEWLERHHGLVACRDLLTVSLAVDFDREDGDPTKPRTPIGELRCAAKVYDGPRTSAAHQATDRLAAELAAVIARVDAYRLAHVLVAMPPHKPNPSHHLTAELVKSIAAATGIDDGSDVLTTTRERKAAKGLALEEKFTALEGTFTIDARRIRGRAIVLLDDVYQSGISMNFVAMKLQEAGATHVMGLAAEKTCRNDANARAQ